VFASVCHGHNKSSASAIRTSSVTVTSKTPYLYIHDSLLDPESNALNKFPTALLVSRSRSTMLNSL